VALESIGPCLQGVIPSPLATCSADGTPNVTYLSIVRRCPAVGGEHRQRRREVPAEDGRLGLRARKHPRPRASLAT
jgi:hypothetical protein